MKRIPHWHSALERMLLGGRSRSFAWGSFDCALFACDCILAETGEDPARDLRGKYSTEAEARSFGSLSEIASRITVQFAMPSISTGHASRGDLVLINNNTAQGALAIVDFSGAYAVCPGTRGLTRVRRHRWQRAWKV